MAEQFGIRECVIHDHIRALEQFRAPQREQTRVAGAGPDEIDDTFLRLHAHSLAGGGIQEKKVSGVIWMG